MPERSLRRLTSPNHAKRLVQLLACIVVGLVIGAIGNALSGSSAWYLALPAVVAGGWLFVAKPTECEPPSRPQAKSSPRNDEAP